jgi:hypothetical protein
MLPSLKLARSPLQAGVDSRRDSVAAREDASF